MVKFFCIINLPLDYPYKFTASRTQLAVDPLSTGPAVPHTRGAAVNLDSRQPHNKLAPMEPAPPPPPPELPMELLLAIIPPLVARLLSTRLRDRADTLVAAAKICGHPAAPPPESLRALLIGRWCGSLETVDVRGVACVDDGLLAELLAALPRLRRLDVSHCPALCAPSFDRLVAAEKDREGEGGLEWAADGCWRLWQPCPRLKDPEVVLRLQLAALRECRSARIPV